MDHMGLTLFLTTAAVLFSVGLALLAPFRSRQKVATWFFAAGMVIFALESVLQTISLAAISTERMNYWQNLALVVSIIRPRCLVLLQRNLFARGIPRVFRKWRILLLLGSLLPVLFAVIFRAELR